MKTPSKSAFYASNRATPRREGFTLENLGACIYPHKRRVSLFPPFKSPFPCSSHGKLRRISKDFPAEGWETGGGAEIE